MIVDNPEDIPPGAVFSLHNGGYLVGAPLTKIVPMRLHGEELDSYSENSDYVIRWYSTAYCATLGYSFFIEPSRKCKG